VSRSKTLPVLVLAGVSSGVGKTTITLGLLEALRVRGLAVQAFKVGPDFIDPAFHALATGRPSYNLDGWMCGREQVVSAVREHAADADVAVVEGVMGCFDGRDGRSEDGSTAQIAKWLGAPVVLVVDASAMARSVGAIVHGFATFDAELRLGGVILNRVASIRHEQLLREALDDIGVPVLGALRRRALSDVGLGAPLPSRQHGVAPVAHGSLDAIRAVRRLGEVIGDAVDIERTMALARSAPRLTADPWSAEDEVLRSERTNDVLAATRLGPRPVIAVAGA